MMIMGIARMVTVMMMIMEMAMVLYLCKPDNSSPPL